MTQLVPGKKLVHIKSLKFFFGRSKRPSFISWTWPVTWGSYGANWLGADPLPRQADFLAFRVRDFALDDLRNPFAHVPGDVAAFGLSLGAALLLLLVDDDVAIDGATLHLYLVLAAHLLHILEIIQVRKSLKSQIKSLIVLPFTM